MHDEIRTDQPAVERRASVGCCCSPRTAQTKMNERNTEVDTTLQQRLDLTPEQYQAWQVCMKDGPRVMSTIVTIGSSYFLGHIVSKRLKISIPVIPISTALCGFYFSRLYHAKSCLFKVCPDWLQLRKQRLREMDENVLMPMVDKSLEVFEPLETEITPPSNDAFPMEMSSDEPEEKVKQPVSYAELRKQNREEIYKKRLQRPAPETPAQAEERKWPTIDGYDQFSSGKPLRRNKYGDIMD